jgi:hypothetical protein
MTIPDGLTPDVRAAIEELDAAFAEHEIRVRCDNDGGAWVVVEDVDLGPGFAPGRTWVGFPISFQYPRAHVYPHYVRPDLARADGRPFAPPIHVGQSMPPDNEPAIMISRASHRWDPTRDTAALKLTRVLDWLGSQA